MIKLIWRKKFLIIFLVLVLALLPMAMTQESTVLDRIIVTGMGIDKDGGEYTIYVERLVFTFDPKAAPERELLDGKGSTLDDAFRKIDMGVGKQVSLSHCIIIVLGKGLADENIKDLLWEFMLAPKPVNTCVLFYTESDVGALMQASIDKGDARSGRLQQIAEFNKKNEGFVSANLEDFVKESVRKNGDKTVKVAAVSEKEGEIENEGKYVVFNAGRLIKS